MSSGPYDAWKDSQKEKEYIKVEKYPTRFKIGDKVWYWDDSTNRAKSFVVGHIAIDIYKNEYEVRYDRGSCEEDDFDEKKLYRTKEDCLDERVCSCCGAKKK